MQLLGWQPRVSLDVGLKATIGYFSMKMASARPRIDIADPDLSGLKAVTRH
jgi:hypothetical protein